MAVETGVQMMEINLSNVCNLRCLTCVRTWPEFGNPSPKHMTLSEFKVVLSRFPGLSRLQICGYSEPLINEDLPDMIKHAKEVGVPFVEMFTNGTLLSGQRSERLAASELDLLRVSIDGGDEETYRLVRGASLQLVTRNVRRFTEASGVPVRMESVLSRYTQASARGLPKVAESAGAKVLAIRLLDGQDKDVAAHGVYDQGGLLELRDHLGRLCDNKGVQLIMPLPGEVKLTGCTAWKEVYVNEYGQLVPCYLTREHVVGNLLESTFEEIKSNGGVAYDDEKTLAGGTSPDCSCGYALLAQGRIGYQS